MGSRVLVEIGTPSAVTKRCNPETNAAAAELVASRIRQRIATDSAQPTLSASIGVAVYPRDGETIEGLLQKADYEMYAMKSRRTAQISLPVAIVGQ